MRARVRERTCDCLYFKEERRRRSKRREVLDKWREAGEADDITFSSRISILFFPFLSCKRERMCFAKSPYL
jgi:hypothetical protein